MRFEFGIEVHEEVLRELYQKIGEKCVLKTEKEREASQADSDKLRELHKEIFKLSIELALLTKDAEELKDLIQTEKTREKLQRSQETRLAI